MKNTENSWKFDWNIIDEINVGRSNLGNDMPVAVYRLFQYTMREVITDKLGKETCIEIFRAAGYVAGKNFYQKFIGEKLDIYSLINEMQKQFSLMKMGILRIEELIDEEGYAIITISEDLDCSGMPISGETVCFYDEGFLKGVMEAYSNTKYLVKEVDCWAKGDLVCRFELKKDVIDE